MSKKFYKTSPQIRARAAVAYALKMGKIKKVTQCERCSRVTDRLEFHHHMGYAPQYHLVGQWLCLEKCHPEGDAYSKYLDELAEKRLLRADDTSTDASTLEWI